MRDARKKMLLNKKFQFRFIMRFVTTIIIWGAATVSIFAYLIEKKLQELRYSSHIDIRTTSELLLPTAIGFHVLSLLLLTALLAYAIHMVWKRLSPPLYSIKRDIARISGGDLTGEVTLSRYDEFQYLAKELDGMRKGLRNKIANIKEQQKRLSIKAADLDRSILSGHDVSLESVALLQSAVARLQEEVEIFRY